MIISQNWKKKAISNDFVKPQRKCFFFHALEPESHPIFAPSFIAKSFEDVNLVPLSIT